MLLQLHAKPAHWPADALTSAFGDAPLSGFIP
jgi:hypothetical protein